MKYHKIRNVPLTVCTAEQKLAYNIAFANSDWVKRSKLGWREEISRICSRMQNDPEYKRFDIDAVKSALFAGFENYMYYPFIATSYEQISKAFPAHYLQTGGGTA